MLLSCKSETPKYGMEFNEEREKIGLPALNEEWICVKKNSIMYDEAGNKRFTSTWINPTREKNKPYHWLKSVSYNIYGILTETNSYKGLNIYATIDGTSREALWVNYYFVDNQWRYVLAGQEITEDGYSLDSRFVMTKEETDSILKFWNIE